MSASGGTGRARSPIRSSWRESACGAALASVRGAHASETTKSRMRRRAAPAIRASPHPSRFRCASWAPSFLGTYLTYDISPLPKDQFSFGTSTRLTRMSSRRKPGEAASLSAITR